MGLVVGVGGKKVPVGNVSMCPAAACRPMQTDLGLVCCVTGAGERFRPGSKLFIHIKTKHKKLPLWLIPSSSLGRKSPFVAGKRKTLLIDSKQPLGSQLQDMGCVSILLLRAAVGLRTENLVTHKKGPGRTESCHYPLC